MGMKKLTEGRGDILNKHGKRKEHHALKIHVTSNFPQRSRDIESRRNSTKGLSLFDTSRKLQSTCFSPHPPPPPRAIKKSTFRKTSNNNESRLLSRARGVSRRGMEREGCIRRLHLLRHTGPQGTSIAEKSPFFRNFLLSIIPAYHVIPQRRKNNRNYTTT